MANREDIFQNRPNCRYAKTAAVSDCDSDDICTNLNSGMSHTIISKSECEKCELYEEE